MTYIDIKAALQQAQTFDNSKDEHVLLICPDSDRSPVRPHHRVGRLRDLFLDLERAQALGAGIFIAGNRFIGRCSAERIAAVRVIGADFDQAPIHPLPVLPSLIVGTSKPPKHHVFLSVDPSDPISPAEAVQLSRLIARTCGADPAATDLARRWRLAGSTHLKGEPLRTTILGGTGRRFRRVELLRIESELRRLLPPIPVRVSSTTPAHRERYIAATIRAVSNELAVAAVGTRNPTLNRSAFRLGQIGLSFEETQAMLGPIALAIGLGDREAANTLHSGWTAGVRNPRGRTSA